MKINPQIALVELKDIAKKREGACLSEEYINSIHKLKFSCTKGHIWEAAPAEIKRGRWCPYCSGRVPFTIDYIKEFIKSKGGECLSETYKSREKIKIKCNCGYVWDANFHNIKSNDSWCPKCSGHQPIALNRLKDIIKLKNGKLIEFPANINFQSKLKIQCQKGHIWERDCNSIVYDNAWCPECSVVPKYRIDDVSLFIKNRGGELLSKEYKNNRSKLEVKCHNGHIWSTCFHSLKIAEQWCPHCAGVAKLSLDIVNRYVESMGGKCLDSLYKNTHAKMTFQCQKGHVWKTSFMSIYHNKTWCPYCKNKGSSKKELQLFSLVKEKFPSALSAVKGKLPNNKLELDIYIPELNKAIEFDGKYWHTFDDAKRRDAEKDLHCKSVGIDLFRVNEKDWNKNKKLIISSVFDFLNNSCSI